MNDPILKKGVQFLSTSLNPDGWWLDFLLAPGRSDEWVTGYVGFMLSQIRDLDTQRLSQTAWEQLQTRVTPEGWGFNRYTPKDGDSTIWALRLAQKIGKTKSSAVTLGNQALEQHVFPSGGISTYADEQTIRAFTNASNSDSFAGWQMPALCVTAAAAGLATFRHRARNYLRTNQSDDGSWSSYWWEGADYSTGLAIQSLSLTTDQLELRHARHWCLSRIKSNGAVVTPSNPSGSPFATAWVLNGLKGDPSAKAAQERLHHWLIETQQADGSWAGSAVLRVPPQSIVDPKRVTDWEEGGLIEKAIIRDDRSIFTTATVLAALYSPIE